MSAADRVPANRLLERVRSGAWLDAQEFPPMTWVIPGIMPEGYGLLTGPPKVGKSWLALGTSLAAASGGHALGAIPLNEPRPVLLMALEDGYRRLQERSRTLLAGAPIPGALDVVIDAQPAEVPDLIDAWLSQHRFASPLVVLDTLGKITPPAHAGESQYQRDYRVGSALKRIADRYPGACLLAVHHTRKAASDDWMDSTSGTNGLNGAADFTISLSRPRNENTGVLRVTGRDVPEGEYALTVKDGTWSLDGATLNEAARAARAATATSGLGDRSSQIVTLVNNNPHGLTPKTVAQVLGMTAKDAGQYLGRLHDSGRIRRAGRGLYTPVETVETVETPGQAHTPPVESEETEETEGPGLLAFDTYDRFDTPTWRTP